MKDSHTINYDGISLYITGEYLDYDDQTNYGGYFEVEKIILTDHDGNEQNILSWFGDSQIEEISRIVTEENY